MKKIVLNILLVLALVLSLSSAALAQDGVDEPTPPNSKIYLPLIASTSGPQLPPGADRALPDGLASLSLGEGVDIPSMTLDRNLVGAEGLVDVVVTLVGDPVAAVVEEEGATLDDQSARFNQILDQQAAFLASIGADYVNLGQAQRLLNAVMLRIDAAELGALVENPEVLRINQVQNYEYNATDLGTVNDYIGASDVQDAGYTGEGIQIAVLDSGVDYTHIDLGGSGDPADYAAQDETTLADGGFPNEKVIGGYDFVGSVWPDGDLAPDEDPLDKPTTVGHGTGTSAIAAGYSGVAPDAEIYGVKVCSSVSSACSGVALISGMEFAVDPNGDGRLNDAVDIINMSLGSNYGHPFFDDLSQAVELATRAGVLTVTSAGNAGDKPYILGTPANTPSALAVAATHTPDHTIGLMEVTAPEDITGLYAAIWQTWSAELTEVIEAPLVYGDGAGGNLNGCAPFTTDLSGYIVLVDRGACNFTLKIKNVGEAGGLVGIIGLVAPGDPFDGGDGGDRPIDIPGYMISQADSNTLKSGLPDTVVKFDPAVGVSQLGVMEGFSSRGPSSWQNFIKPEIAAFADVLTAHAGTGDDVHSFSGTSSSSPVVAGSAALVKQKLLETWVGPEAPQVPFMIKSMLVTNADPEIRSAPLDFFGGQLAPVSRVGGGEVRVDRAADSPIALWAQFEDGLRLPSVSFGLVDLVDEQIQLHRRVVIHNLTNQELVYDLSSNFRFEDDALLEAVTIEFFPSTVVVQPMLPGQLPEANFDVVMTIDGMALNDWVLNSGANGASSSALTYNEIDGYVWLDNVATTDDDDAMVHLPWMVLPRKSGNVSADPQVLTFTDGMTAVNFANSGIQVAELDPYEWLAHSPDVENVGDWGEQLQFVDIKDVGVMTYPVPAGFCSADPSFLLAFAITTYDRFTHAVPNPVFDIYLDVDQDGVWDYDIFNFDLSLSSSLSDGRSVTWVADLETNAATAFFFLGHPTNSANFYLLLCGEQIGMNADNFFEPMDVLVTGQDWYYSGLVTDMVDVGTISPLGERYFAMGDFVAPGTTETWTVYDFGPLGTNPQNLGVMMLLGDAPAYNENLVLPVAP